MPISYTNRKGVTYMLYRGQTRTGKPRYYFGSVGRGQGEPVTELPPGFTISESVNGVVSLVKDRLSLIQPEEVAAIEAAVQQHPEARQYRVAVKRDQIEVYEQVGPDYDALLSELHIPNLSSPGLAERLQTWEERHARCTPVLRFVLLDPKQRRFGAQRMCSLGSIDGWLELGHMGPWHNWPVCSFPPWAQSSSMNSGEPSTGAGVTKHFPVGPSGKGSNPGCCHSQHR